MCESFGTCVTQMVALHSMTSRSHPTRRPRTRLISSCSSTDTHPTTGGSSLSVSRFGSVSPLRIALWPLRDVFISTRFIGELSFLSKSQGMCFNKSGNPKLQSGSLLVGWSSTAAVNRWVPFASSCSSLSRGDTSQDCLNEMQFLEHFELPRNENIFFALHFSLPFH